MNPKDIQKRRDFLKSATAMAVGGGLPTINALSNVALAAGPVGVTEVGADYKAIVCVFLYGGQDASNVLIPYQDGNATGTALGATTVEFDRYAHDRSNFSTTTPAGDPPVQNSSSGNLAYTRAQLAATALPETTLNSITSTASPSAGGWTTNTYGRKFALHPNYTELKAIYDAGKLAVISNVGPLIAPINRAEWYTGTGGARPVNLYSHDDQQKGWMSGTANLANPSIGIAGRIASHTAISSLNPGAKISTQVSVDGTNTFMLTAPTAPVNAIAYQVGTGSIGRLQTGTTTPIWTTVGTVTCNTSGTFITNNPTSPYCVTGGPIRVSNGYSWNAPMMAPFNSRMTMTSEATSIYNDQWRQTMRQSIDTEVAISTAFLNSPPTEEIVAPFEAMKASGLSLNGGTLGAQLRMVAALIRASNQLGANAATPLKRQIFFVSIGGFDTHGTEFWTNNPNNNKQISKAISAFWTAMGNVKIRDAAGTGYLPGSAQDRVTLFTMTEFGRTLDSNGNGSDHGWGSHQIVLGGAVKGGKIYGQDHSVTATQAGTSPYMGLNGTTRADLTAGAVPRIGLPPDRYSAPNTAGLRCNGLNHMLDRGEMLPTTSSDAVVATIAKWFGVPPADITGAAGVFPTLATAHPNGYDMGFMN
ncbi:MAG TPA: DUF1501 domain-containing protein [Casimicrobium sp.]|nr:DUF1501 domain-containing protein [Casimicrobium sp.]